MDYYLVDYENTGENGLKGITELQEDSCVVIFYSENADKISFDMHQKFCICKTKLEFRKINTGRKNALDFQLSTYLGYLIAKAEDEQYYIVSKDNGYRSVVDFWREKKVRQIDFIARTTARAVPSAQVKGDEAAEEMPDLKAEESDVIVSEEIGSENLVSEADAGETFVFKENGSETSVLEENESEPQVLEAYDSKVGEAEDNVQEVRSAEVKDTQFHAESHAAEEEKNGDQPDRAEEEPGTLPGEIMPAPVSEEKKEKSKKNTRKRNPGSAVKNSSNQKQDKKAEIQSAEESQPTEELRASVAEVIDDMEAQEHICRFIVKYKTKQGVNNAIVKIYGTEKAGELYKKIKPLLKDKKGK